MNDRLTLNLGLRYDYVDGVPIEQEPNPNFQAMQAAGARRPVQPTSRGSRTSGRRRGTTATTCSRAPASPTTCAATARDVIRGGWGVYTTSATRTRTCSSPPSTSAGGHGQVFFVSNPAGIRKADGSLLHGRPIRSRRSPARTKSTRRWHRLFGQVASPRLEQPYTRQTNLGWAHQLDSATAVTVDYVRVDGRDINIRFRPNTRINGGARRLADLAIRPEHAVVPHGGQQGREHLRRPDPRPAPAACRRASTLSASYTLGEARRASSARPTTSSMPTTSRMRPTRSPTCNVGPSTRTDARHRVSLSAVVQAPWGIQVAPFFIYRSALPILTFEGIDLNNDGNMNDITARAYQLHRAERRRDGDVRGVGACETVNCSRRAPFSQLNLRLSKSIRAARHARGSKRSPRCSTCSTPRTRRCRSPRSAPAPRGVQQASFMQPVAFAGDFQQPEQRVGQFGFRFSF